MSALASPLADVGNATEDVPVLLESLAASQAPVPMNEQTTAKVEAALRLLTGFALATGTPAEV